MAIINLLGTNTSGNSLAATAQERVNLYYEVLPQADKSQVVAYSWPGTYVALYEENLSQVPGDVVCGIYYSSYADKLFVATTNRLFAFTGAGVSLGSWAYPAVTITAGTKISWAENIASPTASGGYELLFLDRDGPLMRWDGTNVTKPTLNALVAGTFAEAVCFIGGRFVVGASNGRFMWSALNDGNTWGALDFATAESSPDKLVWVQSYKDNLLLFGTNTIEAWGLSPDLNLPYSRIVTIQNVGLNSRGSISTNGESLYFLGSPKSGGTSVYQLTDYSLTKVSTPDIDRSLEYQGITGSDNGYIVKFSGHEFYVLVIDTVPPGAYIHARSYVYDITTGVWSNLSTSGGRYKYDGATAVTTVDGAGFRAYRQYLYSVSENQVYGFLYEQFDDDGVYTDRRLTCPHVFDGGSLNNLVLSRVRLDMENPGITGNFRVGLSISRDGGKTYGFEMLQNLSTTGNGISRCEWRRLGIARDYVFRFRFPDAGKIAIIGAYVETHLANR